MKLIVGFGYTLILDYFSMSTIVGCSLIYSFELQNLVLLVWFELETGVVVSIFSLVSLVMYCPDN